MTPSDKPKFKEALAALLATFRTEADTATFAGYWLALDDLPLESFTKAVRRAMRECRFMPSARELRELSGEVDAAGRAILAWDCLQRAIVNHGAYKSVSFDDPAINATIHNTGGWIRWCDMPEKEFDTWGRKEFERVYTALTKTGAGLEQSAPLVGLLEQTNRFLGHEVAPAVMIATGLPGTKPVVPLLESPLKVFTDGIGQIDG